MLGVKYVAHGSTSGYGMAALAYIRALHNAGVPVFSSFLRRPTLPGQPEQESFLAQLERAAARDPSFGDLLATVRATAQTIAYDTVLVHSSPEHLRSFAEAGKRLAACTVWETDALPEHWPRLLDVADPILVPSRFNAEVFARSGVTRPVHVVPYIPTRILERIGARGWRHAAPAHGDPRGSLRFLHYRRVGSSQGGERADRRLRSRVQRR